MEEQKRLRVWLDDEPEKRQHRFEGWVHTRWPEETIALLQKGGVEVLSLDHDLGEDCSFANPRTGAKVLAWIENEVNTAGTTFVVPRIHIHTQNAVEMRKMAATVKAIYRKDKENREANIDANALTIVEGVRSGAIPPIG